MKVTNMIVAATLAVASSAFAETGIKSVQIDNVTNVYGRAGVASVKIAGPMIAQPANVAEAGRDPVKGETAIAVNSGNVNPFGRS